MTTLQALVLGLVQGITEFLPISSTGHLILVQKLCDIEADSLLFITLLHVGTLVAVIWALREDVRFILRHPWSWETKMVLAAVIPAAVIGAVFEDAFERLFASGITIGIEFVITGGILWWMDTVQAGQKAARDITLADAIWIGLAQGAAILPALSRSGLTIAGGLWRGLDRRAASRFSFLVSIPAILGATLLEAKDLLHARAEFEHLTWWPAVIGMVAALASGYAAVKWTLWLVQRSKMRWFAVYVWGIAAFILVDQLWSHHWFPPLYL